MSGVTLREMTIADYEAVLSLWKASDGMSIGESDTPEAIAMYLARNPGMSTVAVAPSGEVVGAVLCGHDGRRGCLHHLAVCREWRGRGIAAAMLNRCLDQLAAARIVKCNLFVFQSNVEGREFWQHNGWSLREDLQVLQYSLGAAPASEVQPSRSGTAADAAH